MKNVQFLQLQPIDDTGSGGLNDFQQDDKFSLTDDVDGSQLEASWTKILTELESEPDTMPAARKQK